MKTLVCLVVLVTSSLSVISEDDERVPGLHAHVAGRIKRSVDKWEFTVEEKQELLDLHNKYRREVVSSDMLLMTWDYNLERMAQSYADKCIWKHSNNRYNSDFRYIGENLYAKTNEPTPLEVVSDWNNEKADYNYYTLQCSGVCGHYTQIVWAESEALGCGIRFCSSIQGLDWDRYGGGYVIVCNYGPGGNIVGQRPYTEELPACSACPRTHKFCIDGLCSKSPSSPPLFPTTPTTTVEVSHTPSECPVPVQTCSCQTLVSASPTIHASGCSVLLAAMVISLLLS